MRSITLKEYMPNTFTIYMQGYINKYGMMFPPMEVGECTCDTEEEAIQYYVNDISKTNAKVSVRPSGTYINGKRLFTNKSSVDADYLVQIANALLRQDLNMTVDFQYTDKDEMYLNSRSIQISVKVQNDEATKSSEN